MTAISAVPSHTVSGSWDLHLSDLPAYGSSLTLSPWTAQNANTTVNNVNEHWVNAIYDRETGTAPRAELTSPTAYPDNRLRFLVARFNQYLLPYSPLEVALSFRDGAYIEGLPYSVVTGNDDIWINLGFERNDADLRATFLPVYPYIDIVGFRMDLWVYDAGDVVAVPSGTSRTAATVVVERTDRNGTRALTIPQNDLQTALIDGTLTLTDHGAALAGPVTWTVYTDPDAPGVSTTATPSAAAGPVVSVRDTEESAATRAVIGYSSRVTDASSAHRAIGRPEPIVITHGPSSTREGSMTLWCASYDAARDVERVLTLEGPHQLRQATLDGLDMDFLAQTATLAPDSANPHRWVVTVDYLEVT